MITQNIVGAALAIIVVGYPLWIATDRSACIEVQSATALTPEVHGGDLLTVDFKVNQTSGCAATARTAILDGANVAIMFDPDQHFASGYGGTLNKTVTVMVPRGAIPGNAQLRLTLSMSDNWFQSWVPVVVTQQDVNFSILPPIGAQNGQLEGPPG